MNSSWYQQMKTPILRSRLNCWFTALPPSLPHKLMKELGSFKGTTQCIDLRGMPASLQCNTWKGEFLNQLGHSQPCATAFLWVWVDPVPNKNLCFLFYEHMTIIVKRYLQQLRSQMSWSYFFHLWPNLIKYNSKENGNKMWEEFNKKQIVL